MHISIDYLLWARHLLDVRGIEKINPHPVCIILPCQSVFIAFRVIFLRSKSDHNHVPAPNISMALYWLKPCYSKRGSEPQTSAINIIWSFLEIWISGSRSNLLIQNLELDSQLIPMTLGSEKRRTIGYQHGPSHPDTSCYLSCHLYLIFSIIFYSMKACLAHLSSPVPKFCTHGAPDLEYFSFLAAICNYFPSWKSDSVLPELLQIPSLFYLSPDSIVPSCHHFFSQPTVCVSARELNALEFVSVI